MKVLLINDYYLGGGAEAVFRNTISLLQNRGIEVDYFVGSEAIEQPSSIINYLFNKKNKDLLNKKLASFQPTIIHIHSFYHILSGAIFQAIRKYRKQENTKVIFTAHDYYLICPSSGMTWYDSGKVKPITFEENSFSKLLFKTIDYRGWKYSVLKKVQWWYNMKFQKVFKDIDHIVSPSFFLKEAFEATDISPEISVVRNPYHIENHKKIVCNKIPTENELRLIYTGRLSQEKGLIPFLNTLSTIDCNIRLDIFGNGPEKENITQLIRKKKLKNIFIHGYLPPSELQKYIDKANVHLLPSIWYENAPLTIIEGAQAGNIILASDIGGIAEMTKLTESYILVKNWEKELGISLENLKKKTENKLTDKNAFSSEVYLDKIIEIYKKA